MSTEPESLEARSERVQRELVEAVFGPAVRVAAALVIADGKPPKTTNVRPR